MENGDFSFTATDDGTYRYCFSNVLLNGFCSELMCIRNMTIRLLKKFRLICMELYMSLLHQAMKTLSRKK